MSETINKTVIFPMQVKVTYSVAECAHSEFNGTHTEVFDFSKLTDDDCLQYILGNLVIKRQSGLRSKTANEKIKVGTWVVPAPGKRIATSPMDKITGLLEKLTPEQKAALLAALAEKPSDDDQKNEDDEQIDMTNEEEETEPDH